ncbi:MAG TPA: TIGR03667 family PPOX class F420-dependent oxidoreductase [Acidimicrobiia bacterium]|nr:TIGR03667 family PPOX class F420-dependent oxidoreductase [Acidimicrobiia bacterium]
MLETQPELIARLDDDLVGWLTTVTESGQPQSSVVWFLRDGDDLLIYSKPNATKMRNIATNPKIAFNLRGDELGDTMATFEGTATVVSSPTPPHQHPAYFAKYQGQIKRLGWTPEQFSDDYSALIRIAVNRVRSW